MKKRLVIFGFIFITLLLIFSQFGPAFDAENPTWISLLPPLLAVGLAFATHNIYISLTLSVLIGGPLIFLNKSVAPVSAVGSGLAYSVQQAWGSLVDPTNIQILIFASFVLIMIGVIQGAGGFEAIAQRLSSLARSKKRTELVTFLMGFVVFIDDYASTMIVGSSMRPLADRVKLSRQKLAFLVDATSAPIAGLAIVSTWIGYEVGLFNEISNSLQLGQNGYAMFFDALSYRFYCFFMLLFIVFNIFTGIDFGKMRTAEMNASKGSVDSTVPAAARQANETSRMLVAIVPFLALLGFLLVSLWYDGKGPEQMESFGSLFTVAYWRNVLSQSENNILILAQAATLGLVLASVLAIAVRALGPKGLLISLKDGAKKSLIPVTILVLAWSLKSICTDLDTGAFLAKLLGDVIRPELFPLFLFITAAMIAISTGTSWGTMAILIPTAIPLAFHLDGGTYGLVTMISLGSILDGAIMGDHSSPISDTTILSSIATDCDLMEHVTTQMPYSVLVGMLAIIFGYLPAGFGWSWSASIGMVLVFYAIFFFALSRRSTSLRV